MNDEATRKYLHGISRLIQATQRLRPADPSRSSNFNAVEVSRNAENCSVSLLVKQEIFPRFL